MATINRRQRAYTPAPINNEGVTAKRVTKLQELRRSVLACMLWESSFYESGVAIAERISELVKALPGPDVEALAVEARTKMKLRHVPLLLCRELARHGKLTPAGLADVIQRPDEMTEFLAIYWKDGRSPLARSVKRGLAHAFTKFDEYALAKYNRTGDGRVTLRDVLFMVHAKPLNKAQGKLWKRLVNNELKTPDTWEVAISGTGGDAKDKKAEWTRLLRERKLGALALLRNLRNMVQADVDVKLIRKSIAEMDPGRVLPFRFIAAARVMPSLEDAIEPVMLRSLEGLPKLKGRTTLLVDTSPSMDAKLSDKSDLTRVDAALGLAILVRELCTDCTIVAFSSKTAVVPARHGFALGDAIRRAVPSNGTLLGSALKEVKGTYDRLIVITDEESQDPVGDPDRGIKHGAYMVNVSSSQNGVGYGRWTNITGWSESIIDYIRGVED